jgi:UDPglucose 6-dehydrogenase/GDP-mannose 6-dehydrogenase
MSLRISIVGTGYVGLVSAACYAEHGHDVTCVDVDREKVDAVNTGQSFLHEPGLEKLLAKNVPGRLRATTDLASAVEASDLTMVAVPTPFDAAAGRIDLTMVLAAAKQVGEAARSKKTYHAVVLKSTCVPGTATSAFADALDLVEGGVGSCPEFLSEGTAVEDFLRPDRLVYGATDERTLAMLRDLHAGFGDVPRIETTPTTAEAIKYASNALLATCVSFANEIADACEAVGEVDAMDVMRGVHLSRYLTRDGTTAGLASFLLPGCGYGGSCLPKDVAALAGFMREHEHKPRVLDAVAATNDARAEAIVRRVEENVGELTGQRVLILGTAFKPGTADLRQSPAEPIIELLREHGATVVAHDPAAGAATKKRFGDDVEIAADAAAACAEAAAVVLCTAWPEYAGVPNWVNLLKSPPVVVDGRRMLAADSVPRYAGIGLRTEIA